MDLLVRKTETATFMICYTIGLDTSARSLSYVAQYAFNNGGDTIKTMKAMLTEIEAWCWTIENAMLNPKTDKE